jgi:hypothetical protein
MTNEKEKEKGEKKKLWEGEYSGIGQWTGNKSKEPEGKDKDKK